MRFNLIHSNFRMIWSAGGLASICSITYPAISSFVSTHAEPNKQGLVQGMITGNIIEKNLRNSSILFSSLMNRRIFLFDLVEVKIAQMFATESNWKFISDFEEKLTSDLSVLTNDVPFCILFLFLFCSFFLFSVVVKKGCVAFALAWDQLFLGSFFTSSM